MEKIFREEKLAIPLGLWLSTGALLVLWGLVLYFQPHILVFLIGGLMVANQARFLLNRIKTSYQLTLEGLKFLQGEKVLAFVPYTAMREIVKGKFMSLIRHPAVKNIAKPSYLQAYPKLGGSSELSMLVYEEDGVTKVIKFLPSPGMHVFLEDKIKESSVVSLQSSDA
ncbi:MAG: hypothetical protein M0Z31_00450 [Clostridia bacterium]|nr:hypothetical protein [Clostridia bacterium]